MWFSPLDPDPEPLPPASFAPNTQEEASHRRAMPITRLVSGGMRYDDAIALHALSASGVSWVEAAGWLGARNARIAAAAKSNETACAFHRHAAAALRFGQCALGADDDRKLTLFKASVDHFALAARHDQLFIERHEIAWGGAKLAGWLIRPITVEPTSVVIVFGGFDGWREDYFSGAAALVARGVAAFLTELPGQGEARLLHGLFLDVTFVQAIAKIADHLISLQKMNGIVGLWGNSLGGYLAARAVGEDQRYSAVCVNGGSACPLELPDRHPRFWPKVEALIGSRDRSVLKPLDSDWLGERLTCPLLQLHGAPDAVFLVNNAQIIFDQAGSVDKRLLLWDDGEHCLYNHAAERDAAIADFFATRLSQE